jgi:hypothetical protein
MRNEKTSEGIEELGSLLYFHVSTCYGITQPMLPASVAIRFYSMNCGSPLGMAT